MKKTPSNAGCGQMETRDCVERSVAADGTRGQGIPAGRRFQRAFEEYVMKEPFPEV